MQLPYALHAISDLLVRYLAFHPLIINPPVINPQDGKQVKIDYYRQIYGIPIKQGLAVSVYPSYNRGASPTSTNASIIFPDTQREYYHFIIHFYWSDPCFEPCQPDSKIEVPKLAPLCADELVIDSGETTEIEYLINPGYVIISQYLEICRLIFEDRNHQAGFGEFITDFQLININYITSKWDESTNVYWHQGRVYLRLTTAMCKDWQMLCPDLFPEQNQFDPNNCEIDFKCQDFKS